MRVTGRRFKQSGRRYARGEITREQYQEMKRDLEG
ncbi:MAG: SHOCT domain-containing protein [Armatimonadota bacterium]|nr:MAG: SHOCT domain-containing protein [Armatimonadota bacterium]